MVVSFNGSSCDFRCGDDEKAVENRCVCKESAIPNWDNYYCVSRAACARIVASDEEVETCSGVGNCKNDLFLELDGKHCRPACSSGLWMYDKQNDEKKCVLTCPSAAPIKNNSVCITCAEATYLERPIWDESTQLCRPCTGADGGKFWDPDAEECVSACPNAAPKATSTNFCRACAQGLDSGLFWDGTECVDECPLAWDENGICRTCAELDDEKPFWNGKECVAECPSGWFVNEDENECMESCGKFQISNDRRTCACKAGLEPGAGPDGAQCVPPSGKSWKDLAELCAAEGGFVSLLGDACVEQCGENAKVNDSALCVCEEG